MADRRETSWDRRSGGGTDDRRGWRRREDRPIDRDRLPPAETDRRGGGAAPRNSIAAAAGGGGRPRPPSPPPPPPPPGQARRARGPAGVVDRRFEADEEDERGLDSGDAHRAELEAHRAARVKKAKERAAAEERSRHEAELAEVMKLPEEEQLAQMMGFSGFGTTKGKAVEDNHESAAVGAFERVTTRKYRQYMHRVGGFNRPLDKQQVG